MASLRPEIPQVKTIAEARQVITDLYDNLVTYGRTLGAVLPALEGRPELHALVQSTLKP